VKQGGSVASAATQDKRADVLYASFERLREMEYRLNDVTGLREKHVQALMTDLHARGMSASTLQNTLSILRTFAEWIGKAGMVRGIEQYLGKGVAERTSIAKEDKSWTAKGVDSAAKIAEVRERDPRVAIQLELAQVFSLRAREAMQLRPHIADKGTHLSVSHGTKGGRDRTVPIVTAAQREVLDRAKALCATKASSTADQLMKLHQWKNHFYRVVRSCGISRADGFTVHGLRHQYANDRYRELSGSDSPVRGGEVVEKSAD
jgi:integrase